MWRPLSSQLQSVQALLPTQSVQRADFVGHLCGSDVNLGVLGGALSCQDTKVGLLLTRSVYHLIIHQCCAAHKTSCMWLQTEQKLLDD